jgi:hypothetical protein
VYKEYNMSLEKTRKQWKRQREESMIKQQRVAEGWRRIRKKNSLYS